MNLHLEYDVVDAWVYAYISMRDIDDVPEHTDQEQVLEIRATCMLSYLTQRQPSLPSLRERIL